jgi:hypothetical protein
MSESKVRKRNPSLVSASRRLLKRRRRKRQHAAESSKGELLKIVMISRSIDPDPRELNFPDLSIRIFLLYL